MTKDGWRSEKTPPVGQHIVFYKAGKAIGSVYADGGCWLAEREDGPMEEPVFHPTVDEAMAMVEFWASVAP